MAVLSPSPNRACRVVFSAGFFFCPKRLFVSFVSSSTYLTTYQVIGGRQPAGGLWKAEKKPYIAFAPESTLIIYFHHLQKRHHVFMCCSCQGWHNVGAHICTKCPQAVTLRLNVNRLYESELFVNEINPLPPPFRVAIFV